MTRGSASSGWASEDATEASYLLGERNQRLRSDSDSELLWNEVQVTGQEPLQTSGTKQKQTPASIRRLDWTTAWHLRQSEGKPQTLPHLSLPFAPLPSSLGHVKPTMRLQADFHTTLVSRSTWTLDQAWHEVCDIIPWVPVQAGPQSLLVQIMGYKTDAPSKNEKPCDSLAPQNA